MKKIDTRNHTPRFSARLGADAKADLALIAEHQERTSGIPCSITDAIRLAARREAERVRASEKKGGK